MKKQWILAIDPGTTESAYCLVCQRDGKLPQIDLCEKITNPELLSKIGDLVIDCIVIEKIASYGMPVGAEVFDTVRFTGRLEQIAADQHIPCVFLPRKDVKMHLCHSMKANDAAIRQRIIDIYGGKDKAIGLKKDQGPLYGFKADMWAALAIALTHLKVEG